MCVCMHVCVHVLGGGVKVVLVATGSLLSVSPDRVVCKRVVLSGHPYKINRNSAVIRYMFFNRGMSSMLANYSSTLPELKPPSPVSF